MSIFSPIRRNLGAAVSVTLIGLGGLAALTCLAATPAASIPSTSPVTTLPDNIKIVAEVDIVARRFGGPVAGYSEDNEAFGVISYRTDLIGGIDALYADGTNTVLAINEGHDVLPSDISFQCENGMYHDGSAAKSAKLMIDGSTRIYWTGLGRQLFRDGQKISCTIYSR